jgi:hypothetical protein
MGGGQPPVFFLLTFLFFVVQLWHGRNNYAKVQ